MTEPTSPPNPEPNPAPASRRPPRPPPSPEERARIQRRRDEDEARRRDDVRASDGAIRADLGHSPRPSPGHFHRAVRAGETAPSPGPGSDAAAEREAARRAAIQKQRDEDDAYREQARRRPPGGGRPRPPADRPAVAAARSPSSRRDREAEGDVASFCPEAVAREAARRAAIQKQRDEDDAYREAREYVPPVRATARRPRKPRRRRRGPDARRTPDPSGAPETAGTETTAASASAAASTGVAGASPARSDSSPASASGAAAPSSARAARRAARAPRPPFPDGVGVPRAARASEDLAERRRARLPAAYHFPEELPVSQRRDDIARLMRDHPVVIVAGATGSGKTTQLPKIALSLGRGVAGQIGCTQPRRLAATSVAARLAQELGSPLGEAVGYRIRFDGRVDPATPVKFMTDGILLAEIRRDPDLRRYDTLILDEAHERGLNTDFLLGYVKRLLPRRPDLRVAVSSATLATERFAEFFGDAPVVEVEGRVYPVETRHRPPGGGDPDADDDDPDLASLVKDALAELARDEPGGDVLVFLAGEADIRAVHDALAADNPRGDLVLPLFARLPWEQQRRVFAPAPGRRVILSTNVAETSLTLPGVRAVVDAGLARVRRATERGVERLHIEKISRASADQRRGRCGRVGPGVCIRLYSEADYDARPAYTDPEIRRAGLAGVILQMKNLGLGAVEDFPFLDPPRPAAVQEGYRTLLELGALGEKRELTDVGRRLAAVPLEPRLARMLLAAGALGVADEVLVLAAFLSIQDPRERPHEKRAEADAAHRAFAHARSDFVGALALWDFYQDARAAAPSKSAARRACRKHFLNYLRMEEWRDVHRQLAEHLRHPPRTRGLSAADWSGLRPRAGDPLPDRYAHLHQALLAGLLGRVGKRLDPEPGERPARDADEYVGARGVGFRLWPGSGVAQLARLARARTPFHRRGKEALPELAADGSAPEAPAAKPKTGLPEWIVAAEIVDTTRTFARLVAEVEPAWIEKAAGFLAKRSYSEPHYDEATGFVRAYERVSVAGLTVAEKRRVHYGPVNPKESREIFLREALVDGRLKTRPAFFVANRALVDELDTLAHKARRDAYADAQAQYAFYDARLPPEVHHDRALADWLARAARENPRALFMAPGDIADVPPGGLTPDRFPPALHFGGRRYPLAYRFAPGADDDGVTLTVPAADLAALPAWRLDWLVPGWLGEKVACLVRGLPKTLRKAFTPVPDTVDAVLPALGAPERPFFDRLARALLDLASPPAKPEELTAAWAAMTLPPHLRMNLRVIDAEGATLAEGRDLAGLADRLAANADRMFAGLAKARHERAGVTRWDFGELPESVALPGALAFPALVDEGGAAAVRLCRSAAEAAEKTREGLVKLLTLTLAEPIRKMRASLPLGNRTKMLAAADGYPPEALAADLVLGGLAAEMVDGRPWPRTAEAFFARIEETRAGWSRAVYEAARAVDRAWVESADLHARLAAPPASALEGAYLDIAGTLSGLLSRETVSAATPGQLEGLPRYVAALEKRRERLGWAPAKDRARREEFAPWMARWTDERARGRARKAGWAAWRAFWDYRWLLEEWRAGLFAPELAAGRGGVTTGRLAAAWAAYGRAAEAAKTE